MLQDARDDATDIISNATKALQITDSSEFQKV